MNQRIELSLETTINERLYRLGITFGSPYEEAFAALEEFKGQLEQMQKLALEQAAQQQSEQKEESQNSPEESAAL